MNIFRGLCVFILHCFRHFTGMPSKYISVGVFSICSGSPNWTEFNQLAELSNETISGLVTKWGEYSNYISYDVCNSTDSLLEALAEILLREEFFVLRNAPGNSSNLMVQNVAVLYAYVPGTMSHLIEGVSSFTLFPRLCAPNSCDARNLLVEISKYSKYLLLVLERLQWRDLVLVSILKGREVYPYHRYFEDSYKLLINTGKFCIRRITVFEYNTTVTDFLSTLSTMSIERSAFVLFGKPGSQIYLLKVLESMPEFRDSLFLTHDLWYFLNRPNGIKFENNSKFWFTIHEQQRPVYYDALTVNNSTDIGVQYLFGDRVYNRIEMNRQSVWAVDDELSFAWDRAFKHRVEGAALVSFKKFKSNEYLEYEASPNPFLNLSRTTNCPALLCKPAHYKVYGSLVVNHTWDAEHGFYCKLCPKNHIKLLHGDDPCQPCHGELSVDDGKRTQCIDPYIDVDVVVDGQSFYILVTVASCGLVSTCFVFLVFAIKHNTPIVLVSDSKMSLAHLFVIILTIVAAPSTYLGEEISVIKCVGRPLILSILYALNISIVFTKSQKLLNAFLSKVRLTAGETKRTAAIQIFTICATVLVINVLLGVFSYHLKPDKVSELDGRVMVRRHYCNSGQHVNVVIVLLVFFQSICLVQAFRGRHLPSPMNDGMSLVYATFVTTLSFAVSFFIYNFQEQRGKDFLHCGLALLNCLLLVVFLYGHKCFVIVCQPAKNTKGYFKEKRMREVSLQAGFIQ